MTAMTTPQLHTVMGTVEAHDILRDAWMSGKNRDDPYARWVPPGRDDDSWVLVDLPLDWIRPNEAGDLYDGTVSNERARRYAQAGTIDTPIYLLFGPRAVKSGRTEAAVMDGGHRTSAARMRGDTLLRSIMRAQDFMLLTKVRAGLGNVRQLDKPAPAAPADGCSPDIA
jgi:hypothetical protein